MTNEELASLANITPYTVCSLISIWERGGLIRKKRAKVLIRSPEKLFLRAAGHCIPSSQFGDLYPSARVKLR